MAKTSSSRVRDIAAGFVHGLGQMVSVKGVPARRAFPDTRRSPADALKGDWDKLGQDMRRAARTVAASGSR
jgi:hypothetical protein